MRAILSALILFTLFAVPQAQAAEVCGEISSDNTCWYDEYCSTYNDCCDDYEQVCGDDETCFDETDIAEAVEEAVASMFTHAELEKQIAAATAEMYTQDEVDAQIAAATAEMYTQDELNTIVDAEVDAATGNAPPDTCYLAGMCGPHGFNYRDYRGVSQSDAGCDGSDEYWAGANAHTVWVSGGGGDPWAECPGA